MRTAGTIEIDAAAKHAILRPGPGSLFGKTYPEAAYHLVTATPAADRGARRR